jgi:hypothetical protein
VSLAIIFAATAAGSALAYAAFSSGIRNKIASIAGAVVPYQREHAINKIVTQGRAFYPKYSGCGDLWNYVLDKVGAPDSWVNRDSVTRNMKWKPAINISKPIGAAQKAGAWVKYKPGLYPQKGDLVLIGQEPGEMAHVFVVLSVANDGMMKTAEYGQSNNAGGITYRRINKNGRVESRDGSLGRHIVGWIDAEKIPTS